MPMRRRPGAKRPTRRPRGPARKRAGAVRPKRAPRVRRQRSPFSTAIQAQSGMTSMSSYVKKRVSPRVGALSKLGPPNVLTFSKSYLLEVTDGTQGIATVGQWNSPVDILQMEQQISLVSYAATSPQTGPVRFLAKTLHCELDIANSSSFGAIVDIYDIVCKRDTPNVNASSSSYNVGTPYAAWGTGAKLQLTASPALPSGYTDYTAVPGALPTDSQLFRDYYRIVSRKTVLMPQGGQHKHRLQIDIHKSFDFNQVTADSNFLAGWKDYTHFTMVVARGQPMANGQQSTSSTTFGQAQLRFTSTERYEYTWVATSGMGVAAQSTLVPNTGNYGVLLNNPVIGTAIVA